MLPHDSPSLQEGTAPAYKYQKEGLKETGSEVEAPFLSWGKNLTTRTTTEVTYFFSQNIHHSNSEEAEALCSSLTLQL